jgi:hypothetical protein
MPSKVDPSGRAVKGDCCGFSLGGTVGSNRAGGMDTCHLWLLCRHVEVSERGRSLVQSSPTECGVSNGCDRKAT